MPSAPTKEGNAPLHATSLKRARLARRLRGAARRATLSFMTLVLAAGMAMTNAGCFKQSVDVGAGGTTGEQTEFNQWFVLWGLVPITEIDPESVTGGASDYTITSVFTPLDCVINIFTSFVTIYRKSIVVEQ